MKAFSSRLKCFPSALENGTPYLFIKGFTWTNKLLSYSFALTKLGIEPAIREVLSPTRTMSRNYISFTEAQ